MASNIKQHTNGVTDNQNVNFSASYQAVRLPSATELQQSLRNQFASSSSGEKPFSSKSDIPRPLFKSWTVPLSFTKNEMMEKSAQDHQQKKSSNNNHLNMLSHSQGRKKQEVIEIEDDEEIEEKKYEGSVRAGNIQIKQNLKNKSIPLQSTHTNPQNTYSPLKIDFNSQKSPKLNKTLNYGQNQSLKDKQYKIVNDNKNSQPNNIRPQTNRQHSSLNTIQPQNSSLRQQQQPQRPFINHYLSQEDQKYYPKLYPQQNPLLYNGMFPSSYSSNSSMNFPTMMNYGSYPVMNDPSAMMWAQSLPSYNHSNHLNYLYGLVDTNGQNLLMDLPVSAKRTVDQTMKNNIVDEEKLICNNIKQSCLEEKVKQNIIHPTSNDKSQVRNNYKGSIYDKEPVLIFKNPQQKPTSKQTSSKQKKQDIIRENYFKQANYFRQLQSLKTKQHEMRDTSSSVTEKVHEKKIVPKFIVLDSDDEVDQTQRKDKNKKLPTIVVDNKQISYSQNAALQMEKSMPVANLYNSTIFPYINQNVYSHLKAYPYSSQITNHSFNNLVKHQPSQSYKTQQSSKQFNQHHYQNQQHRHLQKTKQIYKTKTDPHQRQNILSDDKHKMTLEKLQNIGKIRQMCQEQQKDLSSLLKQNKHNNIYRNELNAMSLINSMNSSDEIRNINQLLHSATDPDIKQKIMDINSYYAMKNKQMKQQIYNNHGINKKQNVYVSKRNEIYKNGENLAHASNGNLQKNQANSSSQAFSSVKQISGTEHVKRQAQKAYLKTRSRITNQQSNTKNTTNYETERKSSKKQRHSNDNDYDKSMINNLSSQLSTKLNSSSLPQFGDQKQKSSGYTFEWTPRLKRLRDLSKKRDYDSVILIGSDFQADLPRFITDEHQLKIVKAIKRNGLLERLYKHSSQI